MGAFVCMVRGAAAVIVCRYRMDSCVRPVPCVRQLHTIAQRAQSFHDKSALCRAFGLCGLAAGGVEMWGENAHCIANCYCAFLRQGLSLIHISEPTRP